MNGPNPWRFQQWAFDQTTGNPTRKAVLSMLAMMADMNTGRCEAKQDTLAQGVESTKATVAGHLKALEQAGLIARRAQRRRDGGRRGDEFLLLAPGVTEWPDGEPVAAPGTPTPPSTGGTPSGSIGGAHPPSNRGAGTTSPRNDHASQQENASAAERDPADLPPADFPEALKPHARHVMRILIDIAGQHGCKRVSALALGRLMMAAPNKPFVATAHEFHIWAADPPRPIRDVVGTYRTFLGRAATLQATERLNDDGTVAGPASRPGQRGHLHVAGGRAAQAEANIRAMEAAADALDAAEEGS